MIAHDAETLPLTRGVEYRENGQLLALNDGLWATATKDSDYRFYMADPEKGQVAFFGVIQESDNKVMISLRLKVKNQKISEIEMLASRSTTGGMDQPDNMVTPHPLFLESLPSEQQLTRQQLIDAADGYFSAIDELNHPYDAPFHEDCTRIENGGVSANSPLPEAGAMQKMNCADQLETGFSVIVTDIRERRFLIQDEERGLSFAIVFFDHNGTVAGYTRPDGGYQEVGGMFSSPMTFMIAEVFKLVDGKIRQVEAVLVTVPYGMPSGW